MANELTTKEDQGIATPSTVKGFMALPSTQKRVSDLLGDRASQFMTSVSSMIGADDKLAKCEPISLFMACLTAAALDLPINKNLGFAHIIPYENRKARATEAQFQMGWKGYVQLAQRTGQYQTIKAVPVYDGQLIEEDPLEGNTFDWTAKKSDTVIGYVAKFKLVTGFSQELYMSAEEIKAHAKRYSQAYKSGYGPWSDNFDAMALKTVIKQIISKWGPMSVDMQKAVQFDQGIIKADESVEYLDGELTGVKADEDKKAAIIEANAPIKQENGASEIQTPKSGAVPPQEPKESVKEKAARWTANRKKESEKGQQAKLMDEEEPTGDKNTRGGTGRRDLA